MENESLKVRVGLPGLLALCFMFTPAGAHEAADSPEKLSVSNGLSEISVQAVRDADRPVPLAPAPDFVELSVKGDKALRPLKVHFVDIGQGDAEYIELPNGRNVLIDGGPTAGTGERSIAQFLSRKNVTKLDYVVLTHPHADHYNGLKYVFSNLPVANFYDTQLDDSSPAPIQAVREQARNIPGIRISYPAPGDSLDWDPAVQVKVFNSCSEPSKTGREPNSCSIVLKVTYQNTSVFFTGDMPAKVESVITDKFGAQLRSEVLKVGHHGSSGSSSEKFLKAVQPKLAFIEVGADNNYGHPRPDTLARLQAAGATIYRTDLDGTLEYPAGGVPQFSASDYAPDLAALQTRTGPEPLHYEID